MNNRGMGGNKPMSMRRSPYGRRDDGPTIDMDMTNTGRRASTDYEYYEDIFEYYDAMCDLGGSVVWNVVLKWACAEPYYKRDENGSGEDNFFEIATEISKEIKEAIEKETKHLEEKCDPEIFCWNLPDVCAAMESEYY